MSCQGKTPDLVNIVQRMYLKIGHRAIHYMPNMLQQLDHLGKPLKTLLNYTIFPLAIRVCVKLFRVELKRGVGR
jgi:hypothetical protein